MTVQIYGDLFVVFAPRQPRQRVDQKRGVVRRHAQDRALAGEHRDGAFDSREPSGGVDFKEELPRPDAKADVLLALADRDGLPGQLAAAEDADRRNQHVVLEGKRKATLEQELPAVGAGKFACLAAQLQVLQSKARVLLRGRLRRVIQRLEERGVESRELLRLFRKERQLVQRNRGVIAGLRHATVIPA